MQGQGNDGSEMDKKKGMVTGADLARRQSDLIKAMRFPLIVLVVVAHSVGSFDGRITLSVEGWNLYHFFSELVSHNLCRIAVCWFFVIAGYSFFNNVPEGGLSWNWLKEKWKRRAHTLLIPFLFWNLFIVVAIVCKNFLFAKFGIIGTSAGEMEGVRQGPLFWLITGPIDFPLWFMRDLMVMVLISPIVFRAFRKTPTWANIVILLILYALPYDTAILTWRGYFFFSLGACLAVNGINMLALCRKVEWPAYIGAVILLPIAAFYQNAPSHEWLLRAFYPAGMISFMNMMDRVVANGKVKNWLTNLASTVFFIYAAHEVYILGWTKGLFQRLLGTGLAATWIRYLLVPVVVILVCIMLYKALERIMPRTLAFCCGGRGK